MATLATQGTVIKRGDGASPEVFTTITQVKSISALGVTRSLIDVTNLASTIREYNVAIPDGVEMQLEIQYDHSSTQHSGLKTDLDNGTERNFKVELATSPTEVHEFTARVTQWELSIPIDDVVMLAVTLKITTSYTIT